MILTNKNGYSDVIYNAMKKNNYSGSKNNYVSVTGLSNTPRQHILKKLHGDEITEDVEDRFWAFFGTVGHKILDDGTDPEKVITHERLSYSFYVDGKDYMISGESDYYHKDDGHIQDWKVPGVFSYIFKSADKEHEQQLNIYAWLHAAKHRKVIRLSNNYIYRDWRKHELKSRQGYPPKPEMTIERELWPISKTLKRIEEILIEFIEAENGNIRDCTKEERWLRDQKWAVMKEGKKRAERLFDTEEEAKDYIIISDIKKLSIEFRKGTAVRCEGYCNVSPFCSQFKGEK